MSLFVVIRGQCQECGFSRNLYVNELMKKEVPCDCPNTCGRGCPGTIKRVWTGPKSQMPEEYLWAYYNCTCNAGQANVGTTGELSDQREQFAPNRAPIVARYVRADRKAPVPKDWRWSHYVNITTINQELRELKAKKDHPVDVQVQGASDSGWPQSEERRFETIDEAISALELLEAPTADPSSTTNRTNKPRRGRFSVSTASPAGTTHELTLVLPDGSKNPVQLVHDAHDFEEHICELCREFQLPHDSFVLHYTAVCEEHVVGSWTALNALPRNTLVSFKPAREVASGCLDEEAISKSPVAAMKKMLRFIEADACLADEFIADNALQRLLDYADRAPREAIELVFSCIYELLQYDSGLAWLQKRWDSFGVPLFLSIFEHLSPSHEENDNGNGNFSTIGLALCLHLHLEANLLRKRFHVGKPTAVVESAHEAAKRNNNAIYKRLMGSVGGDPEDFRTKAAWLIFGMLLRSEYGATVQTEVLELCYAEDRPFFATFFAKMKVGYAPSADNFFEEVLVERLSDCCAHMSRRSTAEGAEGTKADLARLEKQYIESMEVAERLKAELRNRQKVMERLIPFIQVASSPSVTECIRDVVKSGWSTAEWQQGYSLLHYVCEFSKNPDVVDLVAALCTENVSGNSALDDEDADGHRAGDYASENSEKRIAEIMQSYQKDLYELYGSRDGKQMVPYAPPADGPSATLSAAKASQFLDLDKNAEPLEPNTPSSLGGMTSPGGRESGARMCSESLDSDLSLFRSDGLLMKYWSSIKAGQSKVVIAEMQRSRTTGGLGWSEERAKLATEQLELLLKDAQETAQGGDVQKTPSKQQLPTSASATQGAKGKSKGKGVPPVPTPAASEDTEPSETAQKGKGKSGPPPKGKGKSGPPPPPAKGKSKGKGEPAVEPTKPEIEPEEPMKVCRYEWGRYIFGEAPLTVDDEAVESVWRCVNANFPENFLLKNQSFTKELVSRYSKNSGIRTVVVKDPSAATAKKKKDLEVVTGDSRLPMELGIREFKARGLSGSDLQKAILAKNALPEQMIKDLIFISRDLESNCMRIEAMQAAEPDLPLADLENFMMQLKPIPALEQRLKCRLFLMELPSDLEFCEEKVNTIKAILDCCKESTVLPELLSIALSVTNYVNGADSKLSRADGFHIDALGQGGSLSLVRDAKGVDLRQFILKYFIYNRSDDAEKLLKDLAPLLRNMKRVVHKRPPPDDTWEARKEVSLTIEDFAKEVQHLNADFGAAMQSLKAGQKLVSDRTDPLHTDMVVEFDTHKARVETLSKEADKIEESFQELVKWFLAEKTRLLLPEPKPGTQPPSSQDTTFELFCRTWDDFFMPPPLLLSKGEKEMKEEIQPRFAKLGADIKLDDLQYLWNIPKQQKKPVFKTLPQVKVVTANPNSTDASRKNWAMARKSIEDGLLSKIQKVEPPEHTRSAGKKKKFQPVWESAIEELKQKNLIEAA